MLILIFLLVGAWVVLTLLLTAWTMYVQTYLYTEATEGAVWRGPAAGGAIMGVVLLWVVCDYAAPGRFRPIWEFSSSDDAKPFPELRIYNSGTGKEDVYKLRPGTRNDYRLDGVSSGKSMPSEPIEIIVVDGAERSVFKAALDDKGHFKRRSVKAFGQESKDPVRYVDEKGRVMTGDSLGQLSSFRPGVFFGNVLLNALLIAVLFVALWLLLRFQWSHALGQAVVLWLLLLLFVMPPLLSRTEEVSRQRAAARAG